MVILLILSLIVPIFAADDSKIQPLYKYRYETEDMMKTSASEIPVRGYHIAEGGYYPEKHGYRQNFDRFGPSNFGYTSGNFVPYRQNIGFDNYYRPFYGGWNGGFNGGFQGGYPHHHQHHPHGGFVDKNAYSGEKKDLNDEKFEKAEGSRGESGEHGKVGFSKDEVAVKDAKADSGSYKDEGGFRKGYDDSKEYHGGQHYNHNGEKGDTKKENKNHKKGHSKKGFKTTHHKDESGSTESYYDEANDEGSNYFFDGSKEAFGDRAQSSYKGGHDNNKFEQDHSKKQGHYDTHKVLDNVNHDKGGYDHKGYHGSDEVYKINNGIGQHSLLGRQEANREYHHYPHGYVPFNPQY